MSMESLEVQGTPHGGVVKGLSEWGPVGGNRPQY